MFDSDIISVWGTADSFSLTYTLDEDGLWKVRIPADLSDGTYAVEIFAENTMHLIAHWTGFLYMHNGKACIHLNQERYKLWFNANEIQFTLAPLTTINYEGSCIHGCRI